MNFIPRLIAIELTTKCLLNCKHCRASSNEADTDNELTFLEIEKIFKNISTFARPIIILTGGEPLLRKDVFDIISLGNNLGFTMTLATCGQQTLPEIYKDLKKTNIKRLSFSIDSAKSEIHDKFRDNQGAFDKTIKSINLANNLDIPFQINATISKLNHTEIRDLAILGKKLNAKAFHPFFLVATGRGKELKDLQLDSKEYMKALKEIYTIELQDIIDIKVTCAPQYHIIAGKKTRGCLAGIGFAFISSTGKIQTCGFLDIECGDLRANNYDFKDIWTTSKVFQSLRNQTNYHPNCNKCPEHKICAGCRARAYETNQDYLAQDPYCLEVAPIYFPSLPLSPAMEESGG